jgi:sugar phosphate isomerase/epimerase
MALMKRFGIDSQTVFGLPPLEHVTLAADLGCGYITCGLTGPPWQLEAFPGWSLRDEPHLRSEVRAALRDRGIIIIQADGFSVRPGVEAGRLAADLDIFAELGARQAGGVCMERDRSRSLDQMGLIADMAAERGMGYALEFAPPHAIGSLAQTVEAIRELGRTNVRMVIDAMHFFRSGGTINDVGELDAELVGYLQICDVPVIPAKDDYLREACFERLIPGEGELPLKALIDALPSSIPIGLEVPAIDRLDGGRTLPAFVEELVEASARLLTT